jgi:hypothetical protein
LHGDEFAVDTVSLNGEHKVSKEDGGIDDDDDDDADNDDDDDDDLT